MPAALEAVDSENIATFPLHYGTFSLILSNLLAVRVEGSGGGGGRRAEGEGRHLLRQRNWTVLAFCFSAEEKSIFFLFPTLSTWINCTEPTFQPNLYPLSAAALSSSFSISPAPETLKCSSTVVYQLLLSELSGHDGKKKKKKCRNRLFLCVRLCSRGFVDSTFINPARST